MSILSEISSFSFKVKTFNNRHLGIRNCTWIAQLPLIVMNIKDIHEFSLYSFRFVIKTFLSFLLYLILFKDILKLHTLQWHTRKIFKRRDLV